MVGNDQVQADGAGVGRFDGRADAAVNADDQIDPLAAQRRQRVEVQAVALIHPVGDVRHDQAALVGHRPQRLGQQNGGGHAVGVEVAIDGDGLAGAQGADDAIRGAVHVGQLKRVAREQVVVGQKRLRLGRLGQAAVVENASQNRMHGVAGRP